MLDDLEILELPEIPNVKYVKDALGRGWYCSGDVGTRNSYAAVCVSEDDVLYDRGFGG